MFRRGHAYYFRDQRAGHDRWRSLGSEYEVACAQLRALRGGERVSFSRTRVEQAAREWVRTYVAVRRSPQNAAMTESRVNLYVGPFLGIKPLDRVTSQDCREFRLWLEQRPQGLSPQSVSHILSDLRCLLNWAVDAGLVELSPFPRRLMPRIQERPPDRLADHEVAAVVSIPEPYGFLCRLAVGTGLRWGELTRAQAGHFTNGVLVVGQTKSGRIRRVPVSPQLAAEIRTRVGRLIPFSVRSSGAVARMIRKHSGVDRFHLHQLRHSFACRWLEAGGSLESLREVLGHKDVRTTERYGRLSEGFVRADAERVWARQADVQ